MTPRMAKLADDAKNVGAVVGVFMAGVAVALALAGWIALPAKVQQQGDAIVLLQSDLSVIRARLARIDCVVTAQAKNLDPITECGL